jgi:hypothetical protein
MFLLIIQTGCIPLALGGDHTMTYPILQAIKVHICTNNTDMMYTLSFRGRPHYDFLSVLLVETCTLIAWSIG